ncbi:MAG: hypothetical protein P8105_05040 [Dehalococcoidia bacterium]
MKERKMKNTQRLCPISRRDCKQCVLFRGKHLYLNVCKAAPGTPDKKIKALSLRKPGNFKPTHRVAKKRVTGPLPNIILKVVDAETEGSAYHGLQEAQKWDWNDPTLTRVSEDVNVYSWEELVEIARSKAKNNYRELVVREIPRFMLHEDAG